MAVEAVTVILPIETAHADLARTYASVTATDHGVPEPGLASLYAPLGRDPDSRSGRRTGSRSDDGDSESE